MTRARLTALTAGLLVVAGFPLLRIVVARSSHPTSGALDLSGAWAWPPVVLAGLAASAAVFFWFAREPRRHLVPRLDQRVPAERSLVLIGEGEGRGDVLHDSTGGNQ